MLEITQILLCMGTIGVLPPRGVPGNIWGGPNGISTSQMAKKTPFFNIISSFYSLEILTSFGMFLFSGSFIPVPIDQKQF